MDSTNNKKFISIELTYNEKIQEVIKNVIKMIFERYNLHNNLNFNDIYNNVKKNFDINNESVKFNLNGINYVIKIINRSITGRKIEDIEQLIDQYKNDYKFLIVQSINIKNTDLLNEISNLEVFTIDELLVNIIEHHLIPKHRLLSEEDKNKLLEEYDIKQKNLPRIYVSDIIARYYNAKIGDIMEIERYNPNSGKSIIYRSVVNGQVI